MTLRENNLAGFLLTLLSCAFSVPSVHSQQPVASFYYDERGNVIRQEQDTNGDGKMDRWIHYSRQGQTERVEQDVNFDGKPDVLIYYESARPARQEIASKNDGQIDTWLYLNARGEIERKGQDLDRSGKPTLWVYYQNGHPVRSEETATSSGASNRTVHYRTARSAVWWKIPTATASRIVIHTSKTANW